MFCFALFFHSCTSLHDLMQRWNILVVFLVYVCEDCPTPFGQMLLDGDKRVLRFYAGGTSCTDVSSMGTQTGLFGPSSRPLAIFLSEIRHTLPVLWQMYCVCFFFEVRFLVHSS